MSQNASFLPSLGGFKNGMQASISNLIGGNRDAMESNFGKSKSNNTNNFDDVYQNLLGSQGDFQTSQNNQMLPFGGVDKVQPGLDTMMNEANDQVQDSLFPNTNRVFPDSVP